MFYFIVDKLLTFINKDQTFITFIIGTICYLILHFYLFSRYNENVLLVTQKRHYLYFIYLADLVYFAANFFNKKKNVGALEDHITDDSEDSDKSENYEILKKQLTELKKESKEFKGEEKCTDDSENSSKNEIFHKLNNDELKNKEQQNSSTNCDKNNINHNKENNKKKEESEESRGKESEKSIEKESREKESREKEMHVNENNVVDNNDDNDHDHHSNDTDIETYVCNNEQKVDPPNNDINMCPFMFSGSTAQN